MIAQQTSRPSGRSVWPRLAKYCTPTNMAAISGATLLILLTFTALFATQLSPYDPAERSGRPFSSPSQNYWLGTNDIGQDILSELLYGARVALLVGFGAAAISTALGTVMGIVAGAERHIGSWLMGLTNIVLVLPFLPLLIILATYLERNLFTTILMIGLLTWAGTARVIYAQVLSIAQREYVVAAKLSGATRARILAHHIWPQVPLLVISEFVRACSTAILLEVSLSFLGLGDPLQKSWGAMLYWAQVRGAFLTPAWVWWVLPPGLLIGAVALAFALLCFALERRINPKLM